ncbi:hypothetical protein LJR045_000191 [Microbacterium sp. LjRoot45]|uniref:hypothetical protein n=1 Tax=Microbacterium sp. LjRoot45 TaxID=3342329 RepID=UPI003ECE2D0F
MDTVATARGTGTAGLSTPAGRAVMIFVWLCGVANGILLGYLPAEPLLALGYALALPGALALTTQHDRPLRPLGAGFVLACGLTMTAVSLATVDEAQRLWLVDFAAYLMALLFPRANSVFAAIGWVLQFGGVLLWIALTGQSFAGAVLLLGMPLAAYLAAGMWRVLLARFVSLELQHRSEEAESRRQAVASEDAIREYQAQLEIVKEETTGILTRIAAAAPIDDALRSDVVAVEGRIRDRLRSPELQHPELVRVVEAARRRGIRGAVLAEPSAQMQRALTDAAARQLAEAVDRLDAGSFVIAVGAGDAAAGTSQGVSIVTHTPSGSTRLDVPGGIVVRDIPAETT